MRFIVNPKTIVVLITCMIVLLMSAEAHAYFFIVIPVLAADAGVMYANANALANDDPNISTGVTGVALGSLVAFAGLGALPQVEGVGGLCFDLGVGTLGVASVVYGWRVIRSSRRQKDVMNDGPDVRLIPMLPPGARSERQLGLVVVLSY